MKLLFLFGKQNSQISKVSGKQIFLLPGVDKWLSFLISLVLCTVWIRKIFYGILACLWKSPWFNCALENRLNLSTLLNVLQRYQFLPSAHLVIDAYKFTSTIKWNICVAGHYLEHLLFNSVYFIKCQIENITHASHMVSVAAI